MADESNQSSEGSGTPKGPSTQQEVNLAMMEAIRHLAEYAVQTFQLAGLAAVQAENIARTSGQISAADAIRDKAEDARKAGLRYHNSVVDLWEAFQKDAGDDLVKPRELKKVQIDD